MLRHLGGLSTKVHTRVWRLNIIHQRQLSTKQNDDFNYNRAEYALEGQDARDEEIAQYPRITAEELKTYRTPPRGVKMLVRDFIQDSLYNPHYGYFSRRVEIFSPVEPLNFNEMAESAELDATVSRLYREYDSSSDPRDVTGSRQVWHTPTELFKVFYVIEMSLDVNLPSSSRIMAMLWLNVSCRSICSNTSHTKILSSTRLELGMEH